MQPTVHSAASAEPYITEMGRNGSIERKLLCTGCVVVEKGPQDLSVGTHGEAKQKK